MTTFMTKSFLSYGQLKNLLFEMTDRNLLEKRNLSYYTTDKGRKLIALIDAMQELAPTLLL